MDTRAPESPGSPGEKPNLPPLFRNPDGKPRVAVIIPAFNEEDALPKVLGAVPPGVADRIIVVDNGSDDRTAQVALSFGVRLVREPRRGYGSACLAGVAAAGDPDIYVFLDADDSEDPRELPALLEPLLLGRADVVIGSRILGKRERRALLPQARYGNALAAFLIRFLFGRKVTDLGPFRALTRDALRAAGPSDTGYGFPVETQVRAIAGGLRVLEVPVSYRRRRSGRSKISGTFRGTVLAGWAIMTTILREHRRLKEGAGPGKRSFAGSGPPPNASG